MTDTSAQTNETEFEAVRAHRRYPITASASLVLKNDRVFDGTVANISLGGVFFRFSQSYEATPVEDELIGKPAALNIYLSYPGLDFELNAICYIRNSNNFGIGLEFGVMGETATRQIEAIIEQAKSEQRKQAAES